MTPEMPSSTQAIHQIESAMKALGVECKIMDALRVARAELARWEAVQTGYAKHQHAVETGYAERQHMARPERPGERTPNSFYNSLPHANDRFWRSARWRDALQEPPAHAAAAWDKDGVSAILGMATSADDTGLAVSLLTSAIRLINGDTQIRTIKPPTED